MNVDCLLGELESTLKLANTAVISEAHLEADVHTKLETWQN